SPVVSVSAIRKSLQAKRNEKIPAVIREFLETGSTIDQNARTCPQPSTRAASTIEAGEVSQEGRMMRMAKGIAREASARITPGIGMMSATGVDTVHRAV